MIGSNCPSSAGKTILTHYRALQTMFTCEQCGKETSDEQKCYGYEKKLCSIECFREAGKTYKPNGATDRGGGGW